MCQFYNDFFGFFIYIFVCVIGVIAFILYNFVDLEYFVYVMHFYVININKPYITVDKYRSLVKKNIS